MTPYYNHAGITIYQGDCRLIFGELKFHLVITDPPYGVAFKYASFDDNNIWGYCQLMSDVINNLFGFPVIITVGKRWLWAYPPAKDMFCWQKPGSTRRNNYGGFNEWELVLVYGKLPKIPTSDLIRLPDCANHDRGNDHPCPKPIKLFSWIIEQSSNEDTIILDPFMGSGTTLVAAKQLGRRAIGIEIEEKYCEIAVKRLAQEVLPL